MIADKIPAHFSATVGGASAVGGAGEMMANHFAFLTKAKPVTGPRLLERLPLDEVALVLTSLPPTMEPLVRAYYPDELQDLLADEMREARDAGENRRQAVADKLRGIIDAARNNRDNAAKPGTDESGGGDSGRQPAAAPPLSATSSSAPPPSGTPASAISQNTPKAGGIPLAPRRTGPVIMGANPYKNPGAPGANNRPPVPPQKSPYGMPPATAQASSQPISRPTAQPNRPVSADPSASPPPEASTGRDAAGPHTDHAPYSGIADLPPDANILSGTSSAASAPAAPAEKPLSALAGLGGKLKGVLKQAHEEITKNLNAHSAASRQAPGTPPARQHIVGGQGRQNKKPAAPAPGAPRTPGKPGGKPTQWIPRDAASSPINGPAIPGRPKPVAGDPMTSPLANSGIMELIGRAQEKLLPGGKKTGPSGAGGNVVKGGFVDPHNPAGLKALGDFKKRPGAPGAGGLRGLAGLADLKNVGGLKGLEALTQAPGPKGPPFAGGSISSGKNPLSPAFGKPPGKRPEPVEGVIGRGRVEMTSTPRLIGKDAKRLRPGEDGPAAGARRMDGKAILAAILREAGSDIRETVQHDDPGLFRELHGRMFYFDDLLLSDDAALAQIFTAAKIEDGSLALRFAPPRLRDRVLQAVSPGRARALQETVRKRAGVDAIEEAQNRVLGVALRLQSAGRILIDPNDPDLAGV